LVLPLVLNALERAHRRRHTISHLIVNLRPNRVAHDQQHRTCEGADNQQRRNQKLRL
jgi:hypothetical protein